MAYNLGWDIKVTKGSGLAEFVLDHYVNFGKDREPREQFWRAAIDAYQGANGDYWKRRDSEDIRKKDDNDLLFKSSNWRSNVFVMLIKAKVMAGSCILTDTVMQGGKVPFSITVDKDSPEEYAAKAAEKQQQQIYDQLNYGRADRGFMKAFFSMGLYGDGILNSPAMTKKRRMKYRQQNMMPPGMEQMMQMMPPEETIRWEPYWDEIWIPGVEYRSVWDIFRDMTCENVHEGQGVIDREYLSAHKLRQMKERENINIEAIDRLLSSNKDAIRSSDTGSQKPALEKLAKQPPYCLLRYWGRVPKKYLTDFEQHEMGAPLDETFGFNLPDAQNEDDEIECLVEVVNGEIIYVDENVNERRPYDICPWEMVLDDPSGRSIADNLRDDQKMVNDCVRLLIDNMMLASNVLLAGKSSYLAPGQTNNFYPGKFFELSDNVEDARAAIQQIIIADCSQGLMSLQQMLTAQADSDANLPKIMDGTSGVRQQTAFEVDQLVQNAGKYIGQVIRNVDEYFIEPIIEKIYHYNMLDGKPDAKGDFVINGNGFSSFQSRVLRTQSIKEVLQMVMSNPELFKEVKLRPHIEEIYKGMDLDPVMLLKSDEEKQQEEQQSIEAMQQQMMQEMQGQMQQQAEQLKQTIEKDYDGKISKMVRAIALATNIPEKEIGRITDLVLLTGEGGNGAEQPMPGQLPVQVPAGMPPPGIPQ